MAKEKKKLIVEWTETAEEQLDYVLEYWIERNYSIDFSEKLLALVSEKVEFITEYPLASPKTSFPNSRIAALGHYSIIYTFTATHLIIMAFWDNRQDPQKLFELLRASN